VEVVPPGDGCSEEFLQATDLSPNNGIFIRVLGGQFQEPGALGSMCEIKHFPTPWRDSGTVRNQR
jgi:hypothetical protein